MIGRPRGVMVDDWMSFPGTHPFRLVTKAPGDVMDPHSTNICLVKSHACVVRKGVPDIFFITSENCTVGSLCIWVRGRRTGKGQVKSLLIF